MINVLVLQRIDGTSAVNQTEQIRRLWAPMAQAKLVYHYDGVWGIEPLRGSVECKRNANDGERKQRQDGCIPQASGSIW